MQTARATDKRPDIAAIRAASVEYLKSCATHFTAATLPPEQALDLGSLYVTVGDEQHAVAAFQRLLEQTDSDSARATALVAIMNAFTHYPNLSAGVVADENILQVLNAINDVPVQKIQANALMISFYENFDDDVRIGRSVDTVFANAARLSPDQQAANGKAILVAIESRAKLFANELHPDSALRLLTEVPTRFPGITGAEAQLADQVALYRLVGTHAPHIHADYWLNSQPAASDTAAPRLLMFTANWCHSCWESYAEVTKLLDAFTPKGLRTTFAVDLDGQFKGVEMTPDKEVEENRSYYTHEYHFTVPIAIQRRVIDGAAASGNAATPPPNSTAYAVHYLPQYFVIDRHGIIRGVLQGWDGYGNRARALNALVQQVVSEQ